MTVVLAIDAGTTGVRTRAVHDDGRPSVSSYREFTQHFPRPGWVEHDASEIWDAVVATLADVASRVDDTIAAIGITNQRETVVAWDKRDGRPLANAIVWQDRRTAGRCAELAQHLPLVRRTTGLVLDPYFSGTKAAWLIQNNDMPAHDHLAIGTIDSWLVWNLTAGREFVTDPSNASRTMLFDIGAMRWSNDMCNLIGVPMGSLPEVRPSSGRFGVTAGVPGIADGIPISGIAGDQQSALFGQACTLSGMAKNTYGTGSFVLLNVGTTCPAPTDGMLTTIAWDIGKGPVYALEGSIFVTGAAVQWLRDGLNLFADASETEALAQKTRSGHSVYLVPAFTGLGAPHWDPKARGAIFGLTRDTGIAEIVAAGLQAVCYQTRDLQLCMNDDMDAAPGNLRVDGGMVKNSWVMQFLADMLNVQVDRPTILETTALGAAYLAGLRLGWYNTLEEIEQLWRCEKSFTPSMEEATREQLYQGWLDAVSRVRST